MTISIRQLHPVFAGEVSGADLTKPLSREDVAAIEAGMDKYAVLVFHDQKLTDDQQMAFTRNFGEIENAPGRGPGPARRRPCAGGGRDRVPDRDRDPPHRVRHRSGRCAPAPAPGCGAGPLRNRSIAVDRRAAADLA